MMSGTILSSLGSGRRRKQTPPIQRLPSVHSISSLNSIKFNQQSKQSSKSVNNKNQKNDDNNHRLDAKIRGPLPHYRKQFVDEVRSNSLSMVREESSGSSTTVNNNNNNWWTSTFDHQTTIVGSDVQDMDKNKKGGRKDGEKVGDVPKDGQQKIEVVDDEENLLIIKMRNIPCLGLLMAFISGIFFATAGFTVCLIPNIDATVIVTFRSLVQIMFYLPAALYSRDNLLGVRGERSAILQRSIFGFICFTLSYYALSFLSLSDASAIAFSAPVYVSIFACVLLKEPCGAFQIVTIIVTIVGVLLISRPTFIFNDENENFSDFRNFSSNFSDFNNSNTSNQTLINGVKFSPQSRLIGVILSFLTAITMAYTFIAMRRLQRTPVAVVINFFSFFCVFFGLITILIMNIGLDYNHGRQWLPRTRAEYGWMVANGLCGVGGQLFLVLSLKLEEAGLVSLARTFDIVMAFIYQVSFLHEVVHVTSIIGAIIVCSGVIACALKKTFGAKPEIFDPIIKFNNFFGCVIFKLSHERQHFGHCQMDTSNVVVVTDCGTDNHGMDIEDNVHDSVKDIEGMIVSTSSASSSSSSAHCSSSVISSSSNNQEVAINGPPDANNKRGEGSNKRGESSNKIRDANKIEGDAVKKRSLATSVKDGVQITTTVQVVLNPVVTNSMASQSMASAADFDGDKIRKKSASKSFPTTFRRSSSVVSEVIPVPY